MPGDGRLRISWEARPPRLALAGDIDLTSHAALITALSAARAADSSGRVRIDMAAVRFCDVAGMRIILGGGDGPQPRTTVHNLPPRLHRLCELLTEAPAPDRRGVRSHRMRAGRTEIPMPKTSRYYPAPGGELPGTLQRSPQEAQETFTRALARAVHEHGPGDHAYRVAYAEFKRTFEKRGDHWILKQDQPC